MTQTPPAAPAADKREELATEAAELTADIKEAEQDAQQARSDGDTARADRLEQSIKDTRSELAEIKAALKQLTDRPFHPAPGDEKPPAADGGDGKPAADGGGKQQAADGGDEQAPADGGGKRRHWFFGDRWNNE